MKYAILAIQLFCAGSLLLLTTFAIANTSDDEFDACVTKKVPINIINTYDFFYQNSNKALLAIRDPETLDALFNSAQLTEMIDFNTQLALYAQMGTQPSGGYHMTITAVEDKCHYLEVRVENRQPGADCVTTQALTFPHQLVTIPKSNGSKPILFKEAFSEKSCL
ncbi:PrcB C-terminal [Elysia marginata]|uniref:PrcB C-terminal n=1 Tax=Elysia marginata TaxID=1093978 RepID=A0AAV4G7K7_9GAST|nr:PrcB C-terminal [Elysia marginata]